MMYIRPIHTELEYQEALKHLECLMDAPYGSKEGDTLEILSMLVSAYEEKHSPISPADPIEAIKFRMEQGHCRKSDLEKTLKCGRGRLSEVLNKKRPLSLKMIRALSKEYKIPCEVLVQEYITDRSSNKISTTSTKITVS